ncbi:ATP-binding protein [Tepidibacter hydrothermalis]|uniref:histidine kinase n=1 Tax=Tepidibacter hydrothermalis TaxID=3036126 RepID=A0ABY8EEK7_9FIRM|nr:ATP-binding protein [Tepidibacter hydrothermalis]WFD11206.1 ATP-binding protein [Tepidibacter hydrothermalis]
MKELKKNMLIGLIVAFVSQIYINIFNDDFRVSAGIIFLSIIFIFFKNVDIVITSIVTANIVFVLRVIISCFGGNSLYYSFEVNYPVIFFYLSFGIVFNLLKIRSQKNIYLLFTSLCMSEFVGNLVETVFRYNVDFDIQNIKVLIMVCIVRSSIALIFVNIIKEYNILIEKEEHDERYRKLLFLISSLKTEIYFMDKNMDNIEDVMSSSFRLYEKLDALDVDEDIKSISLSITKDIHEIKKDYIRVIKGIEEVTHIKAKHKEMSLVYIFNILEDSTVKYIDSIGSGIQVNFNTGKDVKVKDHYILISILRNLINNSIESINGTKGVVDVSYFYENEKFIFLVSDNGNGIRNSDKNYIFNPGFSTKFNMDTGDMNRGIGLTIVKEMVEGRFNGCISVESEQGIGTEFQIIIPKEQLEG